MDELIYSWHKLLTNGMNFWRLLVYSSPNFQKLFQLFMRLLRDVALSVDLQSVSGENLLKILNFVATEIVPVLGNERMLNVVRQQTRFDRSQLNHGSGTAAFEEFTTRCGSYTTSRRETLGFRKRCRL